MEGHWWGEGNTEWKNIGGVRGTQNGGTWWSEGNIE